MAFMSFDCPHCLTPKAAFEIVSEHVRAKTSSTIAYNVLLICRICNDPAVAELGTSVTTHRPMKCPTDPRDHSYNVVNIWPKTEKPICPEHTPDNIGDFYLQGVDSLQRNNRDAAGLMFRKTLDAATMQLDPDLKPKTLYQRIEALAANYAITPAMKDWAHHIRDLGNDAAHEEDPFTQDEAESLQAFTELFLTYVFTLPGMLAARQAPAP